MDAVTEVRRQSRLGKRPVPVPKGVTVTIEPGRVLAKGEKGSLSTALPPSVSVTLADGVLNVASSDEGSNAPRLQGLGRALLANMIAGVSKGYEQTLELVGTGYRCEVKAGEVHLQLGFSHACVYKLPATVKGEVGKDSKGTILNLSSPDRAALGQAAATIRGFRPPEPYGGKGVRYRGEAVRRKAGKSGKK
jgi:large subunit ribosomal protein L6